MLDELSLQASKILEVLYSKFDSTDPGLVAAVTASLEEDYHWIKIIVKRRLENSYKICIFCSKAERKSNNMGREQHDS